MTRKAPGKEQARAIQAETGMAYLTCLQLVRGEVSWAPQSKDCVVVKMLTELVKDYAGPNPQGRPCMCEACDP